MKEEGDKLKNQQQTSSSSSSSGSSNSGEGLGPLPGEKVISLDENLPDGALEAYWAQLRREREGQGGGGGGGGGGGEEKKEEGGKAKRKTIKVCGWRWGEKAGGRGGGYMAVEECCRSQYVLFGGMITDFLSCLVLFL